MKTTLPPKPILIGALRVIHCAAYTTRNWALDESIPRKQILDLWEAVHDIPEMLMRWRGKESEELLELYLSEYASKWNYPDLRDRYVQFMKMESEQNQTDETDG